MTANGHSLANISYEDALNIIDSVDVTLTLEVASNVKGARSRCETISTPLIGMYPR
jgi:hypothetical protein